MFTKIFVAVCLCTVFGSSLSLTISRNTKPVFQTQFPNAADENSFFRINRHKQIEFITCPDGFTFDIKDLKCRLINELKRFSNTAPNEVTCPRDFRGTLPNPANCRTFLDCWDGRGFVMPCAAHLLYSNNSKWCECPETANCCEFWEKDPTKLVADM